MRDVADDELVARIGRGDQMAFRHLVDRHLARIVSLARRLLSNPDDAEEVAQEVFLRVWKHAGKWKSGEAKFTTWMHTVTLNLCRDRLRKKKPVALDAVPEPEDPAPHLDDAVHGRQVADRVAAAMAKLPERQREALVLCHHQGFTNIEAARLLDVSVEAVESLLARARRRLKQELIEELPALIGRP